MNLLKNYDIDISKLNLGQHEFRFQIDDSFFELFDYSLIDHGEMTSVVELEKKTTFISLIIKINGFVKLTCDRSLDAFDYGLETEDEIILKYGDEAKEIADDVEIIPFNTQKINVGKYLYEFINIAIPMKKLHPRYNDEANEDQIIFSSRDEQEEQVKEDPRWSELKKLKNKSK